MQANTALAVHFNGSEEPFKIEISHLEVRNLGSRRPYPKQKATPYGVAFVVDDNGLEPLTLRTSSECSTSWANRPCLDDKVYYTRITPKKQVFFKKYFAIVNILEIHLPCYDKRLVV